MLHLPGTMFQDSTPATIFAQEATYSTSAVHGRHSQTDLATSPSSALFTGLNSNESDLETLYKREDSNNYYLILTSKSQESTFLGCGPNL